MSDIDVASWLQDQPLDELIELDGEFVYLRLEPGGAQLGVRLTEWYSDTQMAEALQQGFSSATVFDAGLGQSADGRDLLLSQWLPDAQGWSDAAVALEKLLNQVSSWRAALVPVPREVPAKAINRKEQHLRNLLRGLE